MALPVRDQWLSLYRELADGEVRESGRESIGAEKTSDVLESTRCDESHCSFMRMDYMGRLQQKIVLHEGLIASIPYEVKQMNPDEKEQSY